MTRPDFHQVCRAVYQKIISILKTPQNRLGCVNHLSKLTKNDAKCSDVKTALKPTTGTNAANNVPRTTCIHVAEFQITNLLEKNPQEHKSISTE